MNSPSPSGQIPTRPARRIVIAGATGTVGRLTAARLAAAGPYELVHLTRDPRKAAAHGLPGQFVAADFADPSTLRRPLRGADALLLITNDPFRPEHDVNLLDAAAAGGTPHVVKLSAQAVTDPDADDLITRWQRKNEQLLLASGLPWTLLRPRSFMTHALAWKDSVARYGIVREVYGDSLNACVDPADIADSAAQALAGSGHQRTYALTGPQALSARDRTAVLASVLRRPLEFQEITMSQARRAWRERLPEPLVDALTLSAERQNSGAKAALAHGVQEATGRAPRSFRAWAAEHAPAFAGSRP
ncbi:NAD(P)H-binding protein [Streptomyces sp. QL37]|uniref:NAD(P)H-binding protein n=1 Tax=Streptomyces sp. QL37 TaxID=2093747 RepID=UPI000CF1CED1|nr:NAD(P)H-binding protein [Streptomyces sp. QL37]PPQ61974.1 NAD(P)-dependent oxidoreductase [Streptomyces sp. QL37]